MSPDRDRRYSPPNSEVQTSGDPWVYLKRPTERRFDPKLEYQAYTTFLSVRPGRTMDVLSLSDRIYDSQLRGQTYPEAVQGYLDLALRLSNIHLPVQQRNGTRSVPVLNGIISNLSSSLAIEYAEKITEDQIQQLTHQMDLTLRGDEWSEWFHPKINVLLYKLESCRGINEWLDYFSKLPVEVLDADVLRESADKVFANSRDLRGYGVKTSFFKSPLFLPSGFVFHFIDPEMVADMRQVKIDPPLAWVSIGPVPKEELHVDTESSSRKRNFTSTRFIVKNISSIFSLNNDGEFHLSPNDQIPLKRVFEEKGIGDAYEMWRLFMLSRFFDLTRRADIVDSIPSIDEEEMAIVGEIDASKSILPWAKKKKVKLEANRFKRLVVPRAKPQEEPNDSGEEKVRRFVDRHMVTWFVRPLPKGYHATERAIEYAREHDVLLYEGETIVRSHWRGSDKGKPKLPVKASFRRDGQKIKK